MAPVFSIFLPQEAENLKRSDEVLRVALPEPVSPGYIPYRHPGGQEADGQHGNEYLDHILEHEYHRVGIDDKSAGARQLYQSVFCLKPGN